MRKSIQYMKYILVVIVFVLIGSPSNAQQAGSTGRSQQELEINLSGSVIQEDGSPPPGMLRVELVCDSTVRQQALLDAGGNFSLQFGGKESSVWADANVAVVRDPTIEEVLGPEYESDPNIADMRNTSLGHINLSGCEIRAQQLQGFRSDAIPLGPRSIFDDPGVGVIILQSTTRDPQTTANVTLLSAPPEAVRAYQEGRKEMMKAKANFSEALKKFEQAVAIHPEFAQAWYLLGNVHLKLGDNQAARVSYEKAISVEESYTAPYVQLADLEINEERFERAAELTGQVKKLNPDLPENRYLDGLANYFLDRFDDAEESFRFLDQRGYGKNYPVAYCYIGLIESESGALSAAIRGVEECMELAPETLLPKEQRADLTRQLEIWKERSRRKASRSLSSAGTENEGSDGARVVWVGEREIGIEFRDHPGGVLISDVKWYGAAWIAGLRTDDIVVTVNGQKSGIDIFGELFLEIVRGTTDQGTFTVWRDGDQLIFKAQRIPNRR